MTKITFDIGGTTMRVGAVEGNRVVRVSKSSTPANPSDAVHAFESMARDAASADSIKAVSGGIAGVIGKDGSIFNSPNLAQWVDFPFVLEIEKRLGVAVSVLNDAALAGLGEATHGAGRGYEIVMYVGLGTGIGGARIVRGAVDAYAHGFEPGGQIIDAEKGIVFETLVSGSAIKRRFNVHPKDLGKKHYDELTPILAVGLYNSIAHWSPDAVILGGSLMNENNGYRIADIILEIERLPQRFPSMPEIKAGELKDEAGLYGGLSL